MLVVIAFKLLRYALNVAGAFMLLKYSYSIVHIDNITHSLIRWNIDVIPLFTNVIVCSTTVFMIMLI